MLSSNLSQECASSWKTKGFELAKCLQKPSLSLALTHLKETVRDPVPVSHRIPVFYRRIHFMSLRCITTVLQLLLLHVSSAGRQCQSHAVLHKAALKLQPFHTSQITPLDRVPSCDHHMSQQLNYVQNIQRFIANSQRWETLCIILRSQSCLSYQPWVWGLESKSELVQRTERHLAIHEPNDEEIAGQNSEETPTEAVNFYSLMLGYSWYVRLLFLRWPRVIPLINQRC